MLFSTSLKMTEIVLFHHSEFIITNAHMIFIASIV
jgi:hypothetical protein